MVSAPIEQGSYSSFNKVKRPPIIRVLFTLEGWTGFSGSIPNLTNFTLTSRSDMLAALDAMVADAQVYDIETPDTTYEDYDLVRYNYPKGAIVPSSVYTGQWLNLNEANGTSPESATGANTGWVPINNYGVTQITMTSGSIVMSSLQAAKDRIIISGTLTANVNLIFPAWIKSWVVHNNCTGNFTITCRTASGTGVVVIPGLVSRLFCDGVNMSDETYNPNNDMVGMVAPFAANSAPTGWLAADGSLVSRITYARLFSRIGTTFGAGDGTSTFALPDMRGEFVRGWDNGRGVDAGRAFGSWQKGSVIVGDDGVAGDNVASYNVADKTTVGLDLGGSEQYPISTVAATQSTLRGNTFYGYSRPRNYALLYCIKI